MGGPETEVPWAHHAGLFSAPLEGGKWRKFGGHLWSPPRAGGAASNPGLATCLHCAAPSRPCERSQVRPSLRRRCLLGPRGTGAPQRPSSGCMSIVVGVTAEHRPVWANLCARPRSVRGLPSSLWGRHPAPGGSCPRDTRLSPISPFAGFCLLCLHGRASPMVSPAPEARPAASGALQRPWSTGLGHTAPPLAHADLGRPQGPPRAWVTEAILCPLQRSSRPAWTSTSTGGTRAW